ncbi:MAG: hypothetical protein D6780_04075 [Candidatus Dadabacteria bacterium]|nr:MAG: hypothetical protein D6780_04075 [Candidatus Dadabacteria bacterium]
MLSSKAAVYYIKNNSYYVLSVGKAQNVPLSKRIAEHKGNFKGAMHFQYCATTSKEAAESLQHKEIKKFNLPSNKIK